MVYFPESTKQLVKYSIAAVLAAGSDWVVFIFLNELTGHILISQGLARITGGGVSFVVNKMHSFSTTRKKGAHQVKKFIFLYVVSYVASVALVYMGVTLYPNDEYIVKLVSDSILFMFNFFMMKFFVFKDVLAKSRSLSIGPYND